MGWRIGDPNNVQGRIHQRRCNGIVQVMSYHIDVFPHCAGEGKEAEDLQGRGGPSIQVEAAKEEVTWLSSGAAAFHQEGTIAMKCV